MGLGQSGVAYTPTMRTFVVNAKPATTPKSHTTALPLSITSLPVRFPGITAFARPTGGPTAGPLTFPKPVFPVAQQPTSVGPQVPVFTMPPTAFGPTDQGYGPPSTPIVTPTDGGGDTSSPSGAPPATAGAGINWGMIGLAALALVGLTVATR
jgi:hypothetical protein